MARPLKPLVRGGGYYPSNRWTPLVYPGGYTTANGGGQPEPEAVLKTVTGSLIHIADALALPAKALSVNVEPIQDLHGYDAPWPAGGGKNKLNLDTNVTVLSGSVPPAVTISSGEGSATITETYYDRNANKFGWAFNVESNQTYAVSGNITSSNTIVIKIYATDGSVVYTYNLSSSATTFSLSFNSGTNTTLYFYASISSWGQTITLTNVQIEKGTATTYSPYSNICPISGRTSATVTRTGKNLLDLDRTSGEPVPTDISNTTSPRVFDTSKYYEGARSDNYYYKNYVIATVESGTVSVTRTNENNSYGIGFPVGVIGGNTYTFSADYTSGYVSFGYYDASWNFISSSTAFEGNATITVPSSASFVLIVLRPAVTGVATIFKNIQLELGSTATAYEPYAGNTYTIQLGDTVYGGTLNVTQGKMVVDMAMDVFDGSADENWAYYSVAQGNMFRLQNYSSMKPTISVIPAISNAFKSVPQGNRTNGTISSGANGTNVDIVFNEATSLTEWREWLALNNVQFCYELATPFEITLTPTQIEMLLGENNLFSDGEMTLVYLADGNASDEEALNILLGGRYVNNHGEDEPSDREALDILLGR